MAYENLKAAIKQAIKQNGNQEITGNLLQSTLLNIVNTQEQENISTNETADNKYSLLATSTLLSVIYPKQFSYSTYKKSNNTIASGYWISDYHRAKLENVKIAGVCLNFNTKGTFTIFKGTGIKTSYFRREVVKKVEIERVGWNLIPFDEPFVLSADESLGFIANGDSAILNIGTIEQDSNYELYFYYSEGNKWTATDVVDLMLYVYTNDTIQNAVSKNTDAVSKNTDAISKNTDAISKNTENLEFISSHSIFDSRNTKYNIYFDENGIEHTIDASLGIKGSKIDIEKYVGSEIEVFLGTEAAAYIVITDNEGTVIKKYQSLDMPFRFKVEQNMKYLCAAGYEMRGKQDVILIYSTIQSVYDVISKNAEAISNMVSFGDSITAGYNSDLKWGDIVSKKIGCKYINYAVPGYQVSNMLSSIDSATSDADLIFFFGGTNDWALGNVELGNMFIENENRKTINYDNNTFFGRINNAAKKMLAKYPKSKIFFITPLHRSTYKNQYENDLIKNGAGLYLEQYINAIKTSANYFSIPVIDLWNNSGLNPNISEVAIAYFNHTDGGKQDYLHPDKNGHIRIANIIYASIKKVINILL